MSFDPATQGWRRCEEPAIPRVMASHWVRDEGDGFAWLFETGPAQANGNGVVHGGILATYIDHTMGRTAWRAAGATVTTIQLELQYLRAAAPGEFIEARGVVTRRTRSVLFMAGRLTVGGKDVVAASGIWKVLGEP